MILRMAIGLTAAKFIPQQKVILDAFAFKNLGLQANKEHTSLARNAKEPERILDSNSENFPEHKANDQFEGRRCDPGIQCLAALLRFHGLPADPVNLIRKLGQSATSASQDDLIRLARREGLKARAVGGRVWKDLAATPLPAVARLGGRDRFVIVAKVQDDKVLIQDGQTMRPEAVLRGAFEAKWDGNLILLTRRAGVMEGSQRFGIGWFVAALHKYRGLIGEVLIASFFLQIFALVTPLFFQVVVDKVLGHRDLATLNVLVIGLLLVSVFETVLGMTKTYLFSHTTNRVDVELGAKLFQHLIALPMAYFSVRRVGDSVARVRELENIRQFITGSALTLVIDLFFAIVFLAIMAWYSVDLTLIVVAALPLYVGLSVAFTPLFQAGLAERFRRGAENQAFLVEALSGVETLKAMAVEAQMQRRWEEQLAAYVQASFRVQNLGNYASQLIQFVSKLVTAMVLYFGAKTVMAGAMTVGELVAFTMFAQRVSQPVLRLAQIWQDFHQAKISVDRLGDVLNATPEPRATPGRAVLPPIKGGIRFDMVSFRYRFDGPEALRGVALHIDAGQVVGIVGPSGSGKSTLAKLLQRLYVPERGRVLIDGIDLAMTEPGWLRRQIGVVLQENLLFNLSVRDNIALADPGMPLDKVIEAAKLAGANEFILQLPEGYDTVVGERGGSLSGGQRQRIAIARALIGNPRILIFDEATSALDYESESAIQANMRRICLGRTVIIIAHRLSTVRGADRIITIEAGHVIEDGTHDELVRLGGQYAKLHRLQSGLPK
jgi:subfamily B ATP-binding cassette protein HlyB/CyaB